MKGLFLIGLFVAFFMTPPELSKVRADYVLAVGNKEITYKLNDELATVTKNDNKVLLAYRGAVLTMMAKYSKKKNSKKEFFKEGAELIEYAVTSKPDNIEIRVIRLSIQENSPKFLKYNKNIPEDKQFILNNYNTTSSKSVQKFVKVYVLESEGFNASEKEIF